MSQTLRNQLQRAMDESERPKATPGGGFLAGRIYCDWYDGNAWQRTELPVSSGNTWRLVPITQYVDGQLRMVGMSVVSDAECL